VTLTPEQLQALYAYAGAGVPASSVLAPRPQPAAITMPVVEMGPSAAAPMPIVNPPPAAAAPMPVYSPPVAVNPDADALARQLGFAPPAPAAPMAPSSPVSPLAQGLQLPAGIAPPGTTPAVMAPAPPNAAAVPPVHAAPPPPVAAPPAPPRGAPVHMAPPAPAAPSGPSWTQKRRADEQAYLASIGDERAALGRANDAAMVRDDEAAQAEARIARQKEEYAANEASFQRDEAAARDAFRAQTQQQIDAVRNATIDPGRLYRDSGALTGVMVGIGGALAGMASALNKSDPDAFTKVIQRHIDRDVDAQVRALQQKNASIADRNTMYGQLVADNRDAVLSRAQTTAAMLESARGMAAAEAKRLGTPEAQARYDALDAQLAQRQAQAHAAVDGAEEQAAARAAQAMAAQRAAAAAARAAAEEKRFQRGVTLEKLRLEDKKIDKEHGGKALEKLDERFVATGQGPDGAPVGYLARNPKVAEERTKGLAGAKSAIQIIDTILARREKEGVLGRLTSRNEGSILGSPEWKTANKADHAALLAATKDAWGLGVLSGSDMELVEKYIGKDPNALDLVGDETNDRLRAAKARMQASLDAADKQEAGTRVVKVQRPDGTEGYAPRGGSEAPTNRRAVQRYDAQGRPLK
jgi:hypothetical protein